MRRKGRSQANHPIGNDFLPSVEFGLGPIALPMELCGEYVDMFIPIAEEHYWPVAPISFVRETWLSIHR